MQRRVLMFGWEFPPHNSGGLGVACMGLVRGLSRQGIKVTFVLPKKIPAETPFARIVFAGMEEVDVHAINSFLTPYMGSGTSTSSSKASMMLNPLYGADMLTEVFRYAALSRAIAQKEDYDVIYAHDWLSFPAGIEAKLISGKPFIAHIHSTEFDRCGGAAGVNPHVYAIEKHGMEIADKVVVVSHFTKNIIVKNYGIPAEKVVVVHNGIDDDMLPSAGNGRSQLSSLKEAGYSIVLFLGRITLQKGLDHLLRAAKQVLQAKKEVVFLVSGSGDMQKQMMEFAAELKIAENVLFTGFLRGPEQNEAFRLADLFVMPSVSEPFGIVALEAMKLGTPVLVSKQSGVSEVVSHALKADFWDADELANQILSALAYPSLRSTLIENGHHEADHLSWEKAAGKINHILGTLPS